MLKVFLLLISSGVSNTPAFCEKKEILGNWSFSNGPVLNNSLSDCKDFKNGDIPNTLIISLSEPNVARTTINNESVVGNFTMMANEGLEIFVSDQHYSVIFGYEKVNGTDSEWATNCSRTSVGLLRRDVVAPTDFYCVIGTKLENDQGNVIGSPSSSHIITLHPSSYSRYSNQGKFRKPRPSYLKPVGYSSNSSQLSSGRGGINDSSSLSWQFYKGQNFVNTMTDQSEYCESSYAFATLAALESRFLIFTQGRADVLLSAQEIVSCSHYSQQCDGGHSWEVFNWLHDHGISNAKCFPYAQLHANSTTCKERCAYSDAVPSPPAPSYSFQSSTQHYYAASFAYVGGYLGNCSVDGMISELQNGPIIATLYAGPDFQNVNEDTIITSTADDPPNHTVLVVGYGTDMDEHTFERLPYWTIRNSWGYGYGNNGFIRVYRGNNTLHIEDSAAVINPYVDNLPRTQMNPEQNHEWEIVKEKSKLNESLLYVSIIVMGLCVVLIVTTIVVGLMLAKERNRSRGRGAGASASLASIQDMREDDDGSKGSGGIKNGGTKYNKI